MNLNCLAIGDDPIIRQDLLEAFQDMDKGVNLSPVDSVQDAVRLVELHSFNVIICELQQFELLEVHLREIQKSFSLTLPVVIIGGGDFKTVSFNGKAEFIAGFIDDPILPADVAAKLLDATVTNRVKKNKPSIASLHSILELVRKHQISCTVFVFHSQISDKGFLFFQEGELVEAQLGKMTGDAAVQEIHGLGSVEIVIYTSCPLRVGGVTTKWFENRTAGQEKTMDSEETIQPLTEQSSGNYSIKRGLSGIAGFYANLKQNKRRKGTFLFLSF